MPQGKGVGGTARMSPIERRCDGIDSRMFTLASESARRALRRATSCSASVAERVDEPDDVITLLGAECRDPSAECRVPSAECRVPSAEYRGPSAGG